MVSAAHLAGERGRPVATLELLAPYLAGGDVLVLLGPASELGAGRDPAARRPRAGGDRAVARASCRATTCRRAGLPPARRRGGDWGPGTSPHAARMAGIARAGRAGDGADQRGALRRPPRRAHHRRARRRAAAGPARVGHLRDVGPGTSRGNAEGFLKSGKQMHEVAEEICRLAGLAHDSEAAATAAARPHPGRRRPVCPRPARRPRHRRGALPRVRSSSDATATVAPTSRCAPAARRRSAAATARAPDGSASGSASTTSSR